MPKVRFADEVMENELDMDEDDFEPAEEHDSLVAKLTKLSDDKKKKYKWKAERSEASDNVDQFGLSKDKRARLSLNKLVKLSKDNSAKKAVKNFEKKEVIARPLNEPLAKKAARRVNFKDVSEDVTKYDPIVKEMKKADQLVFPLDDDKIKFDLVTQLDSKKKKTLKPIEEEINKVIAANQNLIETEQAPLTEYELSLLKSKSIEEARIIHRELQRRRLLLSYQEAKFRRQRKIKSKKYHRLEKKKKLKNSVEDFEKLVEENSDKAAETLEELDRLRALERASLKHRNTGKWAKHNKLRAKYDDQAREALEQQMKINAELMKKRKLLSLPGSQLEIDDNVDSPVALEKNMENDDEPLDIIDDYNPWVSSNKPSKKKKTTHLAGNEDKQNEEVEKFFAERIKERVEAEKKQEMEQVFARDAYDVRELIEGDEEDFDNHNMQNFVAPKVVEAEFDRDTRHNRTDNIVANVDNLIKEIKDVKSKNTLAEQQPNENASDDECEAGEDDDDDDDINFDNLEMQNYISEAFADDDVIQEFMKEKAEKEAAEKGEDPQKVEMMPGWGSWAGEGIKVTGKQRQRARRKLVTREKKVGNKICNAIILPEEQIESSVSKYKLKFCPKEVNNMKTFQSSILKPIGSTFNPRSVFKRLTEPKVVTRMGCIIEPMQQARVDKLAH